MKHTQKAFATSSRNRVEKEKEKNKKSYCKAFCVAHKLKNTIMDLQFEEKHFEANTYPYFFTLFTFCYSKPRISPQNFLAFSFNPFVTMV